MRWAVFGGALTLAAGGAGAAYWMAQTHEASLPPAPSTHVPASYRAYREGPGHVVHVRLEGIACKECHDVEHAFAPRGPSACAKCHAEQARIDHGLRARHASGLAGAAECNACHEFGPGTEERDWQCMRCHEEPQGRLAAVQFHASEACSTCHHPHADPAIEAMDCRSCHHENENHHPRRDGAAGQGAGADRAGAHAAGDPNCMTCHRGHDAAAEAASRCVTCHEKPHALVAGHDRCTTCHEPHAFAPSEARACRSCHEGQHVLAEAAVPAHRECTSCHEPHAVAQAGDAACKSCHASISPAHPNAAGKACTGCHTPHPAVARSSPSVPCTSCHDLQSQTTMTDSSRAPRPELAAAHDDRGAHGGRAPCTACHAPHAFAHPTQQQACADCHERELAATAQNSGHATCLGCHQGHPHDAELAARACTSCHAQIHPRQGHTDCTDCHEPHSGAPRTQAQTCARCHAAEQRSVAKVHGDCLSCHEPHQGTQRPAAQCATCHAEQMAQNHGRLAEGCLACHGIHADKGVRAAPQCTSCHAPAKLAGLHTQPAHQQCNKCHAGAHDSGPWSERETCLACHERQRDHVPEAQLCQGCHVFSQ